jgi:DNA polymerase III subunit alpha
MPILQQRTTHLIGELGDADIKAKVVIGGIILRYRPHATKDGKPMGFVTMEDVQGEIEMVLFPRVWEKYLSAIREEAVILAEGRVDLTSAAPKLLVDKIYPVLLDDLDNLPGKIKMASGTNGDIPNNQASAPSQKIIEARTFTRDSNHEEEPDWMEDSLLPDDEWETGSVDSREGYVETQGVIPKGQDASADIAEFRAGTGQADSMTVAATVPGFKYDLEPILEREDGKAGAQMVTIILRSSSDRERDIRRLKKIQGLLLSHPGVDHFAFQIIENSRITSMEFPNNTTGLTPALIAELENQVGKENVRVTPIILQ